MTAQNRSAPLFPAEDMLRVNAQQHRRKGLWAKELKDLEDAAAEAFITAHMRGTLTAGVEQSAIKHLQDAVSALGVDLDHIRHRAEDLRKAAWHETCPD